MMKILKYLLVLSLLIIITCLVHWYTPEGNHLHEIREKYKTSADRYVNINGISAHYRISGQGEPLIIIHGNQGYGMEYDGFRESLSKKYQVIAIDLMGHGFSENAINDDYSLANFNRYIETMIDSLHVTKINLMGHSLGGYLAMQYTKNHPDKVDKLILLNSFGGICATKDYSPKKSLEEYPGVETFSKYFLPKELILNGLKTIMVNEPDDAQLIFDILSVSKRRAYVKYLKRTFTDFDRSVDFSDLPQKKLIITSDLDNTHTPCEAENLALRLSNDSLVLIKGAKHASIRDQPEEIAKVVEEFLSQ